MRNISLSNCSVECMLVVDANELLENLDEVTRLFNSKEFEKYNTVTIQIINYTNIKKYRRKW